MPQDDSFIKLALVVLLLTTNITGAYPSTLNGLVESNGSANIVTPLDQSQSIQTYQPALINGKPPIAPLRQLRINRTLLNGQIQDTGNKYVPLQATRASYAQLPEMNHGEVPVGGVSLF